MTEERVGREILLLGRRLGHRCLGHLPLAVHHYFPDEGAPSGHVSHSVRELIDHLPRFVLVRSWQSAAYIFDRRNNH